MERTFLIDILLAHYNGKEYVDGQILSILNQSIENVRLVILDDYSRKKDYEYLLEKYGSDKRIEIHRNEQNLGLIKTFEKLLSFVQAPYFGWSDQDDVWRHDKLELCLDKLKKSEADLVYSDLRVVTKDLELVFDSKWKYSNTPPYRGRKPISLVFKNPISGCAILARKSLIAKVTPFPKGIPMHDRWMGIVASLENGIDYINVPTLEYRQHDINDTGSVRFGISGLKTRVGKSGFTSIREYNTKRLEFKRILFQEIAKRSNSPLQRILAKALKSYVKLPYMGRLIMSPLYFLTLVGFVFDIGIKNIMVEVAINIVP